MMDKQAERDQMVKIGEWAIWAYRQSNALALFREVGARCPHGPVCQECFDVSRVRVAQIVSGQDEVQG